MHVGVPLLSLAPGQVGGSETYVRGLLTAFNEGYGPEKATVLSLERTAGSLQEVHGNHVSLATVPGLSFGDGNIGRSISLAADSLRSGLIAEYLPANLDLIYYPLSVPVPKNSSGKPTVVTIHDVQHHDLPNLFSRAELLYRRFFYDKPAQKADRVITVSQFSADRISEALGIPRDRVHGIHSGVDHTLFTPDGSPADIGGLPERYIYYPANGWTHKNHARLFEAMAQVEDPNIHIVLTGRLPTSLLEGRGKRVFYAGAVSNNQVAGLYRGAIATVFPSLYEGLGLPPLEAMACGCPVVASDLPPIRETCGDAAILFDATSVDAIARSIRQVLDDAPLRATLTRKGLARSAGFTWQASAEAHTRVFGLAIRKP